MTYLPENLKYSMSFFFIYSISLISCGRQTQILIAMYMRILQQLKYMTWLHPQRCG